MFKRSIRLTQIIRSTAKTGEGVLWVFNVFQVVTCQQSACHGNRSIQQEERRKGQRDNFRPLRPSQLRSWPSWPCQATYKRQWQTPSWSNCTLMSSLHLGVLCCTATILSPDQLLPLVHSQANCCSISTLGYWGVLLWQVLRSTVEYYSPDPVVGLFRSQRSKLLLICAPRRNLFSANGHDSKTKDVLN